MKHRQNPFDHEFSKSVNGALYSAIENNQIDQVDEAIHRAKLLIKAPPQTVELIFKKRAGVLHT